MMQLSIGKYEITTENGEKQRLTITQDGYPESPREWDNVAEFIGVGRALRYGFFDTVVDDSDELSEYLHKVGDRVEIPLYIYKHSGIAVHTYKSCGWDSSRVGVAVISKEKALFELNCTAENWKEKAREAIDQELETLNQYLEGDIYCYCLERVEKCKYCGAEHAEEIDSCCGFFGIDSIIGDLPDEWQKALNDGTAQKIH